VRSDSAPPAIGCVGSRRERGKTNRPRSARCRPIRGQRDLALCGIGGCPPRGRLGSRGGWPGAPAAAVTAPYRSRVGRGAMVDSWLTSLCYRVLRPVHLTNPSALRAAGQRAQRTDLRVDRHRRWRGRAPLRPRRSGLGRHVRRNAAAAMGRRRSRRLKRDSDAAIQKGVAIVARSWRWLPEPKAAIERAEMVAGADPA